MLFFAVLDSCYINQKVYWLLTLLSELMIFLKQDLAFLLFPCQRRKFFCLVQYGTKIIETAYIHCTYNFSPVYEHEDIS
jgi:hypothetical protein